MKLKFFLLLLIIIPSAYIAYCIYHQPYKVAIADQLIPTFRQVILEHTHEYKSAKSLPVVGGAIIDLDNDRQPEIFVGGGFFQSDALFKYSNGLFENIAQDSGLVKDFGDSTYGAAVIDSNNDGYSDLFIARDSGVYLYLNKQGFLHKSKLKLKLHEDAVPLSITLADLNQDGYVDMFVTCYLKRALFEQYGTFNRKQYGVSSYLLLNKGDNTFKDITESAGLNYRHNTYSALFADFDNDRKMDLAVAHEAGQIRLYRNLGNLRFKSMPAPMNGFGYPMGLAAGDYNNDGYLDLFAANIGSSVPTFLAKGDLKAGQRLHKDWLLLKNLGDFRFEDIASDTKVAAYELGRGAVMMDFNLDGLQDLVVSTNFIEYLPQQLLYKSASKLLIQTERGEFAAAQHKAGIENRHFGSVPLVADFDANGYPDIIYLNVNGPAQAYLNNGGEQHFLKVVLENIPASLGARVLVTTGTGKQLSEQWLSGEGLASDQSHVLYFGLGFETTVQKVEVHFISGRKVILERPTIDTSVYVTAKSNASLVTPEDSSKPGNEVPLPDWEEPTFIAEPQ